MPNEYLYAPSGSDRQYCYPDSDVLINRFDLRDAVALADVERKITYAKLLVLHRNPIAGGFDLRHLCAIHRYLFEDIYAWAGTIRHGDFLAKGNAVFCRGPYIESYAHILFAALANENCLCGLPKALFVDRLAYFMSEVNALHPFREGNGRTQRAFFMQLAQNAGYRLDLARIAAADLLEADVRAFHGDDAALKALLHGAIERIAADDAPSV